MSLEAFGVKNLRCLVDTGLVPIRPVTVLVGRNSSGKSTFLRAFPLLRQSVETRRNTPILWYGDEHPVDFGSLRDAASAWLPEPSVTFMFRLRLPTEWLAVDDFSYELEMTLTGSETPFVSEYRIRVEGHEVRCLFSSDGIATGLSINGRAVKPAQVVSLGGRAHLIPTLQPGETSNVTFQGVVNPHFPEDIDYETQAGDALLLPLANAIAWLFHGNSSAAAILDAASEIRIGTREEIVDQLASLTDQKRFQRNLSRVNEGRIEEISSAAVVFRTPYILEAIDQVIAYVMSRVAYLAPLRVSAQRAYRITNYAVDEVEPDGRNLAMFLRSLSPDEVESFAAFTREVLGFETQVRTTGMHAEILVRAGSSRRLSNLVDVGFGYSEVLPLAAVLWNSCLRPTLLEREPPPLVAIEQPELHLHPAHQARLARMLVEAVTRSPGTKIIVETHSEALINGLGKLIYEGLIKAGDVQIVLFDQDEETERTSVRLAGYREDGALHDWPYGFLSATGARRVPPAAAE